MLRVLSYFLTQQGWKLMKKIIVVSALTASSFAMAADLKWNVEGRFDYVSSNVKHETVTATNGYEEKRM